MVSASSRRGRVRPGRITEALLVDVACSLTDRDRAILTLLRRHRVLMTSQLQAVLFTDANTARHRLTRLHRLRLVERFRLLPRVAAQLRPHRAAVTTRSTEYGYVLDRLGAFVLAAQAAGGDAQLGRVRWRTDQALAIAASPRLAHTLGVNGFFTDLAGVARSTPGAGLVTWWGETYCRSRFDGLVLPDGVGVWAEDGRRLLFAVEYDRGTETLARLAGKLDGYLLLETATGWQFTVLVSLPGPRREAGARARLGRHGLAVATTSRTLPGGPAAAVWAPVGANPSGERVRLVDLPGWSRSEESRQRIDAHTHVEPPAGTG